MICFRPFIEQLFQTIAVQSASWPTGEDEDEDDAEINIEGDEKLGQDRLPADEVDGNALFDGDESAGDEDSVGGEDDEVGEGDSD